MYRITILTKYNTIVLEREDCETDEMKEILSQPYILDVKIEKIGKIKKLTRSNLPKREKNDIM